MTDQVNNLHPLKPELADLLMSLEQKIRASLHCVKVGEIKAYDSTKRTATVELKFIQQYIDGETSEYPLLPDCPVFVLSGGASFLSLPVAAGDPCIVLFSDRDIDLWSVDGNAHVPNTGRMHSISDAIAIVGIRPLSDALAATAGIAHLGSDKKILIESFLSDVQCKMSGPLGRFAVKNSSTSGDLFTIMNKILDQFATLTVTCTAPGSQSTVGTLTAAQVAALKLELATVMKAGS